MIAAIIYKSYCPFGQSQEPLVHLLCSISQKTVDYYTFITNTVELDVFQSRVIS
ncbi:hypothetical protein M2326_000481 [Flavobacterium sp. 7A]|nr:hypothetical protein [Flavobacterium sp. 7A]